MRDQLVVHIPVLRRYAHALTGNHADAEDLLQDCLERAVAHRSGWRGQNLRAWLFTIMTNQFRNALRGQKRRPGQSGLEAAENLAVADTGGDPIARRHLARALDALAPEARAVLVLVVIEDCTYAEAADILGVPVGTVMSRLSRARRQLARVYTEGTVVPLAKR